jgi:hypothetical protein
VNVAPDVPSHEVWEIANESFDVNDGDRHCAIQRLHHAPHCDATVSAPSALASLPSAPPSFVVDLLFQQLSRKE